MEGKGDGQERIGYAVFYDSIFELVNSFTNSNTPSRSLFIHRFTTQADVEFGRDHPNEGRLAQIDGEVYAKFIQKAANATPSNPVSNMYRQSSLPLPLTMPSCQGDRRIAALHG